jgi:hypothetical protein
MRLAAEGGRTTGGVVVGVGTGTIGTVGDTSLDVTEGVDTEGLREVLVGVSVGMPEPVSVSVEVSVGVSVEVSDSLADVGVEVAESLSVVVVVAVGSSEIPS